MASRKEQKEQARAARLAQEQQHAAKAQRTRRMQIFGGAIAIAIVIVAVVVVVSTSGGKNPTSTKATPGTSKQVSAVLGGIDQSGTTLGSSTAKVTMTYYGDLECPICKEFTLTVLPDFISAEVRTGTVKIKYRSLCTATCDNSSVSNPQSLFDTQQVAAYAAGLQNKFWDYAELFYHEQGEEDTGYVTNTYLTGLAKQIPGLNLSKWQADRSDPTLLSQVTDDMNAAAKAGFQSTPTIVMTGPKGSAPAGTEVEPGEYSMPSESQLLSAVKTVS